MFAKIKQISDSAYNFKEALDQAKINLGHVDSFRKNVESLEYVPKTILEKQVISKFPQLARDFKTFQSILASSVFSCMWQWHRESFEAHRKSL